MEHEHDHSHVSHETLAHHHRIYIGAWLLALCIAAIELLGFYYSGSLALLADIGHVATDTLIALVPLSVVVLQRHAKHLHTLIERAGGIIAALLLIYIGVHILEATQGADHEHAHEVSGLLLFAFALLAAGCNYLQHLLLRRVSPMHRHAAHSGFHFHVLTDLIKNIMLPILGIAIMLGAPHEWDLHAATIIGVLVIVRACILLAEATLGHNIVQKFLHRVIHSIAQ